MKKKGTRLLSWAVIAAMTASTILSPLTAAASQSEPMSDETAAEMQSEQDDIAAESDDVFGAQAEDSTESSAETDTETEAETGPDEETEAVSDGDAESQPKARSGGNRPGLLGEYYLTNGSGKGVTFGEYKSKTIDYNIRFSDMDPKLLEQTGQDDYAGVKWSGWMEVPEDGNYKFHALSDNGFRFWIEKDGQEVQLLNYWDGDSWDVPQTSEAIALEAGTAYKIRAEYFDYIGGSHVTLSWSNDQSLTDKVTVPSSALSLPDDYQGLYIDGIDTSEATLIDDESFDGTIKLIGEKFSTETSFELVKASGMALAEAAIEEIDVVSANEVQLKLAPVPVGTYKIKAGDDEISLLSKDMIVVAPGTDSNHVRDEKPQQLWSRNEYLNLNGWWDFDFDPDSRGISEKWYQEDRQLARNINVPFSWESPLSGIEDTGYLGEAWYQKKLAIDPQWDGRKVFLMFGAVDWKCKLWVNGQEAGEHIGGYSNFEIDITDYIEPGEENTLTLWVEDKGVYGDDSYPALIGKQGRDAPCGYIHTGGIWQTVGIEARNATYMDNARAATDIDASTVTYSLDVTSDSAQELTVEYGFTGKIYDIESDTDNENGSVIPTASQQIEVSAGANTVTLDPITVSNPKLWNYNDPNLYYGTLTLKNSQGQIIDTVDTYFGMRKVEQRFFDESLGVKYFYVNDQPVYMSGLLDQGYWEDGVYTAPSEDALKYDILQMKLAGFNMIRKHLKIEDPLQYYWCDKIGMFVWQDMPHATNMVPDKTGDETLGRDYYEECLDNMMERNYNHPSIVAVMLFNETWGLQKAYMDGKRDVRAADGRTTAEWVEELYHHTKELNPNLLVEDMSPCNHDHVQPTDMNTYHFYPDSYAATLNDVERFVNNAYVGSTTNFKFGHEQDGDVLMNSEYGGVGAYSGDYDVSYCFKYMTDIQRRYEKQSGFVYTEPYDVEYERNGIMTYDRKMKVFGYDEIAYGGDMALKDLTQEIYVGIVDEPIRNVKPGQKLNTKVMAIGWTNDLPEQVTMKWRFDATDIYGNNISTGAFGQKKLTMSPYRRSDATITYKVPAQACVGTLTVWLENAQGEKIAKNFTNVVAADQTTRNEDAVQFNKDNSVLMKAAVGDDRMVSLNNGQTRSYTYTLPEEFDLDTLQGMRVIAEASSYKGQIGDDKFLSSFSSQWGQTAEGRERASDMEVSINGVSVDTVHLPDNPRDMRGTLTLNSPYNGKTSAGDFGYLVNLNITADQLEQIKAAIGSERELTVTYGVDPGSADQNGLRLYSSTYGRYAVSPSVVLNPADITENGVLAETKEVAVSGDNYSVEALLAAGQSYTVRNSGDGGYIVGLSGDGSKVQLVNAADNSVLGEAAAGGESLVKVTLFDEHIRVYLNNDPEAVIDVYDYSGFSGGVVLAAGIKDAVIAPESYAAEESSTVPEEDGFEYHADFSEADFDTRFEKMGNHLQTVVNEDELSISGINGDKVIIKDINVADGTYEADVTVQSLKDSGGNTGFTFRSSNYQIGSDGVYGYYAGIGNGYIQVGRMSNNWHELAKVNVPGLTIGSTHHLKVAVYGSRIQVYLNDEKTPYVDISDNTYKEGGAAIRAFQSEALVKNVKITDRVDYRSDFEHGVGEWNVSGKWKVADGAYQSAESGALAFIDGRDKSDVTVTADLQAKDQNAQAVLLLRGANSGDLPDGYHVTLNAAENKLLFVKCSGGEQIVLAERMVRFEAGKFYTITAEAKENRFKIYVNNRENAVIEVQDDEFARGVVGVYCAAGTVAVDNVMINHEFVDGPVLKDTVKETIAKIDKIGTVKLDAASRKRIDEARKAYNSLSKDEQFLISNYNVLTTAEAVYKALEEGKKKEADQLAAGAVEKIINEIGTVGYNTTSKARIEAAKAAYNKLTADQKKLVKNYSKLTAAEQQYKKLEAESKKKAEEEKKKEEERKKEAEKNKVKKGKTYTVSGYKYKVTSVTKKTVTVTGVKKKTLKSISVKNTVKIGGKNFKVTAIGSSAFKNCKRATKVTVGKYVKTIGSKAFYNCKKVSRVTINSSSLKKVGSKAFKGIKKNAKILVPKKKLKSYKKILKNKGQSKSVVIKKK